MKEKIEKMTNYFENNIASCAKRAKQLLADERSDEAVFEKIKGNIYDIFRTVFSVALQTCKDDCDAVKDFFDKRLVQIPTSWAASYEKAAQHNNIAIIQIEKIKLDTVAEIQKTFESIWSES